MHVGVIVTLVGVKRGAFRSVGTAIEVIFVRVERKRGKSIFLVRVLWVKWRKIVAEILRLGGFDS